MKKFKIHKLYPKPSPPDFDEYEFYSITQDNRVYSITKYPSGNVLSAEILLVKPEFEVKIPVSKSAQGEWEPQSIWFFSNEHKDLPEIWGNKITYFLVPKFQLNKFKVSSITFETAKGFMAAKASSYKANIEFSQVEGFTICVKLFGETEETIYAEYKFDGKDILVKKESDDFKVTKYVPKNISKLLFEQDSMNQKLVDVLKAENFNFADGNKIQLSELDKEILQELANEASS